MIGVVNGKSTNKSRNIDPASSPLGSTPRRGTGNNRLRGPGRAPSHLGWGETLFPTSFAFTGAFGISRATIIMFCKNGVGRRQVDWLIVGAIRGKTSVHLGLNDVGRMVQCIAMNSRRSDSSFCCRM